MSDAEVQDAGAGRGEDDVLWFHIPVDDAGIVDGGEGLGGTSGEGVEGAAGERAMGGEMLIESEPGSVGGGPPGALGIRVCCEEGHEAWPLHSGGQLDLSAKAGPELRVLGVRGVNHLHRDTEAGWIETGVNGAHAARAETANDPVGADLLRVTRAGRLYPRLYASDAHSVFVPLLRWSAMRLDAHP